VTPRRAQHSPLLAAGNAGGFTLIEILVVVVIIALVATGAVLSLSAIGQDRQLENESERIVTLMNYAREQAELQTRELGLYCGQHSYQFLAYDPRTDLWGDVKDDEVLRLRQLPAGLTLRLAVEAREVLIDKPADVKSDNPQALKPHVMILSNGDLTAFELTLERDGTERTATLAPDDQGVVKKREPPVNKT